MAMSFWQRMTAPSVGAAVAENLADSQSGIAHSVTANDNDKQTQLAARLLARAVDGGVECPQREPIQPSPHADVLDEYEALAKAVGFDPPVIKRERVRCLLASMGLYIYERAKVEAFLTSKFGKEKRTDVGTSATWCWRPMREADRVRVSDDANGGTIVSASTIFRAVHVDSFPSTAAPMLSANGMLARYGRAYGKPVPMPILRTVQRVLEIEPKARFFISDETSLAERFRDPFLAVQLPSGDELHVIERWDEPSFRG